MSHVNEGQLHAYLDGAIAPSDPQYADIHAHLAGCADCRARLEQERAIRADANAILSRAVPRTTAMPSFEELVARKAAREEPAPIAKRKFPVGQLAMAATLVLAMGAALLTTAIVRSRVAREDAALTQSQPSVLVATPNAPAPIQSGPATAAPAPPARVAQAPAAASANDAKASAEASPPPAQTTGVAVNEADFNAEAKRGTVKGQVAVAPAASPPPAAVGEAAALSAVQSRDAAAARSNTLADAAGVAGMAGAAEARTLGRQATERWIAVERAEAERRLGSKVFTVAGLPVVSFEVPAAADQRTVRVKQTLASGSDLELVEQTQLAAAKTEGFERAREKPAAMDKITVTGAPADRRADAPSAAAEAGAARKEPSAAEQKRAAAPAAISVNQVIITRGALQIQARAPMLLQELRNLLEHAP